MPDPLTEAQLRAWMERMGPSLIAVSTGICHDRALAEEIVQAFLETPFEGGRHQRRVDKIDLASS